MMLRPLLAAAAAAALIAAPALADGHAGNTGYALAYDSNTLVVMPDIAAPDVVKTFDLEKRVDALAWRPVTGELLGFSNGAIYNINPANGRMTDLKAKFMADAAIADDATVAFDFNNKIDAVRAVTSKGDNLVYFPKGFGNNDEKASSVRRFTSVAYGDEDVNAGAEPLIFANAYTNAIPGAKASGTFQYALDANTNSLVSLANNAGTLETIAPVTVDGQPVNLAPLGGLDIVSKAEGQDASYAILQMEGASSAGLYAIDMKTGAATLISDLGIGGISSFALSLPQ
ncbi:MAG: DUF4394 domain-containing protein [Pseudomonadota bacterium]